MGQPSNYTEALSADKQLDGEHELQSDLGFRQNTGSSATE